MKFLISLFLIILLSFAAGLYLPWWTIAIVSFVVVLLIPQRPGAAFLCGFLSLFFFWGLMSWWLSNQNEHLLAHKISILILKMDNPFLLILVTALIGAIVAGLAALTASFARRVEV